MTQTNEVRLEHALVDIRDFTRSLAFYSQMLPGWSVRWEGKTGNGHRWVHFGPAVTEHEERPGYLSLYETPDLESAQGDASKSVRLEHVGFAHPDVDGLVERLSAKGIKPNDRADDGKFRRVYFLDPDGHQLEFVQKLG